MSAFIEIKDVRKSYGTMPVLKGINLSVAAHEVICLIGASGSGKSTLLRCMNGLETINEGQIVLDGDIVTGDGVDLVHLRRRVGMIFQSFNLFPHLTVLENVTLAPVTSNKMSRAAASEEAMAMLKRVGLDARAHYRPDQLSGGQQQRVAIVRAMLMHPSVLLMDEITSALDPALVREVLDLVRELARSGMTILMATHEMAFAREVSSRVCFLHQGILVEQGTPEQIFGSPQMNETQEFLRAQIKGQIAA
ncbi:polar amino acid transport system ATP-binding protein [Pararhizobium capsulatum DSM 1112]|uniref:Polar amino acid transport system ATP-binding protein n=1 Tax=Pararhizobium capsulatum DSM 1112 TaxID=1121113 RepID=A0ABU0C4F1_9HYPH|nr:amino acid ABC transporter ATP-binding protein [Pararhizobium capsulatum]MDQ0323962.1 polar amino acid transport system ATP-binding protein [Pararhizobium capsulatum DSM 1112]